MISKEISNEVKKKLIDIGEKQSFLARKLKITPQRLNNILNGKVESLGKEKEIIKWLEGR